MASSAGRYLRVVAGIALIIAGLWLGDVAGVAIAVIGAVPFLAGLFDVCVLSALFGGPFAGSLIRAIGHRG
jgi:hypothetical protein